MSYTFSSSTINAGSNAKTVKGDDEYVTAVMYLAPHNLSGFNVCAMAETAHCIDPCLNLSGRGKFTKVQNARIAKTLRFFNDRTKFMEDLIRDINKFVKWCAKKKVKPAIRLNGTSDIRWESVYYDTKNIFEHFPKVQFYDYTKITNRRRAKLHSNYHLTWSYSEPDDKYAAKYSEALLNGMNIAVVFRDKDKIPSEFLGCSVVDGDKDDLRFLDPKGVVVSLYAKGPAKKDQSGFVIDVKEKQDGTTNTTGGPALEVA